MDLVELFFRATGAFYLFAGQAGGRAMLRGVVTDRMIATLTGHGGGPAGKHAVLGVAVVTTATGGAALALMSVWALPLFAASLVLQWGWLVWGGLAFPPRDGDEERSRRRAANAASIHAAAALGVLWLWEEGRLGAPDEPLPAGLILVTALGFAVWLWRNLGWRPRPGEVFDDPDLSREPGPGAGLRPLRVRLDPYFGAWPLVDVDRGHRFDHLAWLPEELASRIEDWDDLFQLAFHGQAGKRPDFGTADRATAYVEEGRAIVLALCDHFGADKVEVSAAFDGQS